MGSDSRADHVRRQVAGDAPGKIILLGEHAVVYGKPAIAAPVWQVQATATLQSGPSGGMTLCAPNLGRTFKLAAAAPNDPLAAIVTQTLEYIGRRAPDGILTVRSTIPIAGGMGSGAAVSTAIVRALAAWAGKDLAPDEVSRLVFEVEKLHHGTPSGIDNTVIAYGQPIYFVRGQPPRTIPVGAPLRLLIADSGASSSTRKVVGGVRQRWQADPARYEAIFAGIAGLVETARQAIEQGDPGALGAAMSQNHRLLQEMGVSTVRLDELVAAADAAGALGAKLSGAGGGGNVVALGEKKTAQAIKSALRRAGAVRVIAATVSSPIR